MLGQGIITFVEKTPGPCIGPLNHGSMEGPRMCIEHYSRSHFGDFARLFRGVSNTMGPAGIGNTCNYVILLKHSTTSMRKCLFVKKKVCL